MSMRSQWRPSCLVALARSCSEIMPSWSTSSTAKLRSRMSSRLVKHPTATSQARKPRSADIMHTAHHGGETDAQTDTVDRQMCKQQHK